MSVVDVAGNLVAVMAEIGAALRQARRQTGSVTLVAVTKTLDAQHIRPAIDAGHRVFGENRVQEAASKWPALRQERDGLELHLIGALQTNKAVDAVTLFDVIESVDRPRLITALAKAMARTGCRPRCFIQVNTGGEEQKAGCLPGDADGLIAGARTAGLDVAGLMCIPPFDEEPSPHFSLLAAIARRNGLEQLSMGMSADYATAIAHGATHVRVGTAIFGSRRP
ncbi:MAG: YggS family pyridoxal phosphate-dependent enzyme [Alphaproteobacteria bacterium]|nr:YggS family pyridoxal phosphate-dependent enzyme [Alphaproteobacteria bacterium]